MMYRLIALSLFVALASAGLNGDADRVIRKYWGQSLIFQSLKELKIINFNSKLFNQQEVYCNYMIFNFGIISNGVSCISYQTQSWSTE